MVGTAGAFVVDVVVGVVVGAARAVLVTAARTELGALRCLWEWAARRLTLYLETNRFMLGGNTSVCDTQHLFGTPLSSLPPG